MNISNKELFLRLGWLPPSAYGESPEKIDSKDQIFTFDMFQDLIIEQIKKIPSKKVALLLSGGIDSALIGLCALNADKEVIVYTVTYDGIDGEEKAASNTAKILKIEHKILYVSSQDCLDIFEQYVNSHKKIHAEWSGLPLALLMKKVKEDGIDDVLLGDGGDDLFGGYSFFKILYGFEKQIPGRCGHPFNRALMLYIISRDYMKPIEYQNLTGEKPNIDFEFEIINYITEYFENKSLVQGLSDYDIDNWLNQAMAPKVEAGAKMYDINAHAPILCDEIKIGARTIADKWRINKRFIRAGLIETNLHSIMHIPKLGFKPPFVNWLNRDPWKNYLIKNLDGFKINYILNECLNNFTGSLFAYRCLVWNKKDEK